MTDVPPADRLLRHRGSEEDAEALLRALEDEGLRTQVVGRQARQTGASIYWLVDVAVWGAQQAGAAVVAVAVDRAVRRWRERGARGQLVDPPAGPVLRRPEPPRSADGAGKDDGAETEDGVG
ncbi:MAG: hypothetical protein HY830_20170 [Actinobacteria bacterium]|nr:hypothetical protein [Actinomycetota bacterium]